MANESSKDPNIPQPQNIPLAKIHDLPGATVFKQPDKSYGGLVTSIQAGGVKEPVILRLREDGEYQLVSGYRRRRASELAKKQDIPALVYEMSLQDALKYHAMTNGHPNMPVPGKLAATPSKEEKVQTSDIKRPENPTASVTDEKSREVKPAESVKPPAGPVKPDEKKAPDPKTVEKPAAPATSEKPKEPKPAESVKPPADPVKADDKKVPDPKVEEKPAAPAAGEKSKESKPAESIKPPADPVKADEKKAPDPKAVEKPAAPAADEKPKEPKPAEAAKAPAAVTGPAAKGPAGTAISQVFEERLAPPDDKALKDLPSPKEGESFFITLHPGYLENSQYNVFSVDQSSENFKELLKSVELVGIKDPVLARLKPEGGLEILSGQRRHLAASALNYPVPTIIQKIDDADAKIIVADGNLHRDKISTYDLSRALRMKMEGMKQKSGRRKKGTVKAEELDSDEKLAQEMGMKVSKLNRIIRLSEAIKDVCDRVDDNSLPLSIASAISFLKPDNQEKVLHLSDLAYKLTNERIERMKKVEKSGKLDEMTMRGILEDKDLAPKQAAPPPVQQPPAAGTPSAPTTIPPSPDVRPPQPQETHTSPPAPAAPEVAAPAPAAPEPPAPPVGPAAAPPDPAAPSVSPVKAAPEEKAPFKGEQERPEYTKVILAGDRLRKYFPDVSMTPREIEESVYDALEERRQRQIKAQQKDNIFKKSGPNR